VGIGTPRSVKDAAGRTIAAKTFFDQWTRECPGYVGEAIAREGGIIPTYRPPRVLHRRRVLSLGDAARLCDPATGGGIAPALGSGIAAADAVFYSDPQVYERRVEPFRREARARWWFKQVFLGLDDEALRRLFDLFCTFPIPAGEVNPYSLRRPLLRHLRRGGFRPARVLLQSGRFWRALLG
jgi:flavin-dependent dehydrogenase